MNRSATAFDPARPRPGARPSPQGLGALAWGLLLALVLLAALFAAATATWH